MPVHLERDIIPVPGPGSFGDFWRSDAALTVLPDGVNDTTDSIIRNGRVAVQNTTGAIPGAPAATRPMFEVANGGRSGTDLSNSLDPIYATGNITGSGSAIACQTLDATTPKFYFGHSNQTQGFAISFNTIAHVGAGDFYLQLNGNGQFSRKWELPLLANNAHINESICGALTNLQGFYNRRFVNGAQVYGELHRFNTGLVGGALGWERFLQLTSPSGGFQNYHKATWNAKQPNTPGYWVNASNQLSDRLITLFNDPNSPAGSCYSIGLRSGEMAFFITNVGANFRWRRDIDDIALMALSASSNLTVDPSGNAAGIAQSGGGFWGDLRFGSEVSNTYIKSPRDAGAGANQFALVLGTAAAARLIVKQTGIINLTNVPTFATDALAGAGGMVTGDIYKDIFGALRIKL